MCWEGDETESNTFKREREIGLPSLQPFVASCYRLSARLLFRCFLLSSGRWVASLLLLLEEEEEEEEEEERRASQSY